MGEAAAPRGAILYQPYYCEENIWQLCRTGFARAPGFEDSVCVVSNPDRTVACWDQRAARAPDQPVVWDYHVVLLQRSGWLVRVWDLDSRSGAPLSLLTWLRRTFPYAHDVAPAFRPLFRLIPAARFVAELATDRSHMRRPDGSFIAPVPPWDPPGAPAHNLERWLDVSAAAGASPDGRVVDLAALARIAVGTAPFPRPEP